MRAPLKVVCVIMVPLERDVNLVSLVGSKHCAHRLKQTEKQWCRAGVRPGRRGQQEETNESMGPGTEWQSLERGEFSRANIVKLFPH